MNERNGFTLIEVVLSITIASIVVLAVFSAFQLIDSIRTRQEQAGLTVWEGDLVLHRLRMLARDGYTEPLPGETSRELVRADGSIVRLSDGVLVLLGAGGDEWLSSPRARVSSLSFREMGDEAYPGLLQVEFTIAPRATASADFGQVYRTTLYAY